MEETASRHQTPHITAIDTSDRGSHDFHDSTDSGYLSTPHSGNYTPVTTCKSRVAGVSVKRHQRIRIDPWQSERAQRHRSKLNHLLNISELDYPGSESSIQETSSILEHEHRIVENIEHREHGPMLRSRTRKNSRSNMPISSMNNIQVLLNGSEMDYDESLFQETSLLETSSLSGDFRCSSLVEVNMESQREEPKFGPTLRSRTRKNWKPTVPITPASGGIQILSPPPSPAVPSSSFVASEPVEDDVEMKLVIVPQSTPHIITSPRCKNLPARVNPTTFSPICRRNSPAITSAENQKLSKLSITDLAAISEIKPKKLDFSRRALSVALHRTRAMPDYTGTETVDLLALLGEKSNHWRIISKILSFLSPQDLCAISMVSKVWRRICANDYRASMRRINHIVFRQNAKENLKLIKKAKVEGDIQSSPKSRYARKGCLREVQNLLQVPTQRRPPSSPPVSPSKMKFHSFVKASRTLAPWEHLLPCPRCSFPCHVDEKNVGTCSRQSCSMEFCASCSSRPHTGPCKTPLLATPTKRNKRLVVGSRQSKRNLRRL